MRERAFRSEADVDALLSGLRRVGGDVGLGRDDVERLLAATAEILRNAIVHGGGEGTLTARPAASRRRGVRVAIVDHGPGIADLDAAFRDGYSTSGGLGRGLGSARRIADELTVRPTPGGGTSVVLFVWGERVG